MNRNEIINNLKIISEEKVSAYHDKFSKKYDMCLLSHHLNNLNLKIPDNFFVETNRIKPNQNNNTSKYFNIDIEVKDISYFYTTIPSSYEKSSFHLIFDIKILYDEQTSISEIMIVFINNANKKIKIEFNENNLYFYENFGKELNENEICKIRVRRITKNYILVRQIYNILKT